MCALQVGVWNTTSHCCKVGALKRVVQFY